MSVCNCQVQHVDLRHGWIQRLEQHHQIPSAPLHTPVSFCCLAVAGLFVHPTECMWGKHRPHGSRFVSPFCKALFYANEHAGLSNTQRLPSKDSVALYGSWMSPDPGQLEQVPTGATGKGSSSQEGSLANKNTAGAQHTGLPAAWSCSEDNLFFLDF